MKNIIYLVVDALGYESINKSIGNKKIMSFLNETVNGATYYNNIYAQAPYTEASYITLIGNENTLDNGGYFFGNGNVEKTIFERYKEEGYETFSIYSPYIYSKSYLRGVDDYVYTRLFSFQPLYLYRLEYFIGRYDRDELMDAEYEACYILLEEAFETWKLQCKSIINSKPEAELLINLVENKTKYSELYIKIDLEAKKFCENKKEYLLRLFSEKKNHILFKINDDYNKKRIYSNLAERVEDLYYSQLLVSQIKYNKAIKKDKIDYKYVINMMKYGERKQDWKGLVKKYKKYHHNNSLTEYIDKNVKQSPKEEANIYDITNVFVNRISQYVQESRNYVAYMHIQDFHLPTVFHSVFTKDEELVCQEFKDAVGLLSDIEKGYKGNIIADLGASYIDKKIKYLYEMLKTIDEDFLLVITADHGYPCYDNPPRPRTFNQKYTQAFHIPLIVIDSGKQENTHDNRLLSNRDFFNLIGYHRSVAEMPTERNYVLCEYAGPGTPVINEKEIWYTLISNTSRVSGEAMLGCDFSIDCIKEIYNRKIDPEEKYNIVKCKEYVQKHVSYFASRHSQLNRTIEKDNFLYSMINGLS